MAEGEGCIRVEGNLVGRFTKIVQDLRLCGFGSMSLHVHVDRRPAQLVSCWSGRWGAQVPLCRGDARVTTCSVAHVPGLVY